MAAKLLVVDSATSSGFEGHAPAIDGPSLARA
jgi:hypothetical protein